MFPLRDDNPTLRKSVVTFTFIGLNIFAWFFLQGFGFEPALSGSVCQFGLIPGELLGKLPEGTRIALSETVICISDTPNWISVFSHMFMHGGWLHIIGNLWFLTIFGDNVEDSMGRVRFVAFYLLCGLAAMAAQIYANPSSALPMVGASGAISGVLGAYAVLFPRTPVHMLIVLGFYIDRIIVPAYIVLGYWFLLQLLGALPAVHGEGGIAFWAHIGGFVAGATLISIFKDPDRIRMRQLLIDRKYGRW